MSGESISVKWFRRADKLAEFSITVDKCPVCGERKHGAILIRVAPEFQDKHELPTDIGPLDKLYAKIKCDRDNCPYKNK